MLRSSPDALARHLLRNLIDIDALRGNELAAAFLGRLPPNASTPTQLEKVSAWVHRGVETLSLGGGPKAPMHAEILRRCDLFGEPHAVVSLAVGLSRRAFYYERRAALTRLAVVLNDRAKTAPAAEGRSGLDAFELRAASAKLFDTAGRADLALRESEDLVRTALGPEQRIRAWALLLESQCLAGKLEDARLSLHRVEKDVRRMRAASAESAAALAFGAGACANVRWNIGEAAAALELLSAVERKLEAAPGLLAGQAVARAWAQTLMQAANFNAIVGRASAALAAIRKVTAILSPFDDADADTRTRLLTSQAFVLLTLDQPLAEAEAAARSALTLAQRHGLLSRAVEASAAICLVQEIRGEHSAALNTGRPALLLADRLGPHPSGIFLRLILARAHAEHRDAGRSLALFEEASRAIPPASALAVFRDVTAASVALARDAYRVALRCSRGACERAQQSGFARVTGTSMALQARALHALKRPRAAASAADAAVAILEKGGPRYALAEAYEISSRLTHNRHHANLATDLRAILGARPTAHGESKRVPFSALDR